MRFPAPPLSSGTRAIVCALLLALAAPALAQVPGATPEATLPRLVPQIGHAEGVRVSHAAFSPDGARVATADASGNVVVWDVASGVELRRWAGPAPYGLHFADDVTLYVQRALASDETLSLLDGSRDRVPTVSPTDWDMAATLAPFGRARSQHLGRVVVWGQYVSPPEVRAVTRDARGWRYANAPPVALVDPAAPSFQWPADPLMFRLSPEGRHVAGPTGVGDEAAVWSAETGRRVATLGPVAADARRVPLIAFRPGGGQIAAVIAGAAGPSVAAWSLSGEQTLRPLPLAGCPSAEAISMGDGGWIAALCPGSGVFLADPASDAEPSRVVEGGQVEDDGAGALAFSPDASFLLVGTTDGPALVETSGEGTRLLRGAVSYPTALASGADRLVGGYEDGIVRWDPETGRAVRVVSGEGVRSLALRSEDIVFGTESGARQIGSGERAGAVLSETGASFVAVSPDSQWVGAVSQGGRLTVRSRSGVAATLDSGVSAPIGLAFGGEAVVVASSGELVRVPLGEAGLDASAIQTLRVRDAELDAGPGGVAYSALAGSPDGVLAATTAGSVYRWRGEDPEPVRYATCLRGATASGIQCEETAVAGADALAPGALLAIDGGQLLWVKSEDDERAVGFHPGAFAAETFRVDALASAGRDGTIRVWGENGTLLATLIAEREGGWLVTTPEGRFDAPDLEQIDGAVWVAPDDPLTPLPIEAFMREYYEPRLLPRLLAGEAFPDIGSILDKNRVQPEVEIAELTLAPEASGGEAASGERRLARVRVRARGTERTYADSTRASGVRDVRLFRDGQLVRWADGLRVPATGAWDSTFAVPLASGDSSVAFSAYAFNRDLVKSRTARATLDVPPEARTQPRRPRAFVVALGVDRFADQTWNLSFAAADARAYSSALDSTLIASGAYADVVAVPLISQADTLNGTAAALRGALLTLAGEPLDAAAHEALAAVPGAARLDTATPDDVVIVTASTHGYADSTGVFYLFPSDIPRDNNGLGDPALMEKAISSDELSAWLRGVDAGTLAVVVDACNAAGAVDAGEFKPGPMGARGLGQLAFSKGAAVLTATQADAPALEVGSIERGLLTFALVENGLLDGQADGASGGGASGEGARDGRITLDEWLAYAAARVPSLYEEIRAGELETFGREGVTARMTPDFAVGGASGAQTPALFDFRRGAREVILDSPPDTDPDR